MNDFDSPLNVGYITRLYSAAGARAAEEGGENLGPWVPAQEAYELFERIQSLERERDGFQKRVVQLEQRYRHYHEAAYENGVLTDRCLQCGEDLRSNIHSRSALRSPEDK